MTLSFTCPSIVCSPPSASITCVHSQGMGFKPSCLTTASDTKSWLAPVSTSVVRLTPAAHSDTSGRWSFLIAAISGPDGFLQVNRAETKGSVLAVAVAAGASYHTSTLQGDVGKATGVPSSEMPLNSRVPLVKRIACCIPFTSCTTLLPTNKGTKTTAAVSSHHCLHNL